jgi:hypothetical protein
VVPWAVGTTLLVGTATEVPTAAVEALMATMVAVAKARGDGHCGDGGEGGGDGHRGGG